MSHEQETEAEKMRKWMDISDAYFKELGIETEISEEHKEAIRLILESYL
ncbi:hypothetical protein [Vibrio campbellii]|nr:hypothetical protein [Vibrio campbellii]